MFDYSVVRMSAPGSAATFDLPVFSAERGRSIRRVRVTSSVATTSSAGNLWEVALANLTSGEDVATLSTLVSEFAINTPLTMTLDAAQTAVAAGDVLRLEFELTGAPGSLANEYITVEVEWV